MTTTNKMRKLWQPYRCIHASSEPKTQVRIWNRNRGWTPTSCLDAWAALDATLLSSGYPVPKSAWVDRKCPNGINNKDCKESGLDCSLHNYGLAIDIDPGQIRLEGSSTGNPHFNAKFGSPPKVPKGQPPWSRGWDFRDCDLTRAQVEAVEGLKTRSGARVFQWLGWTIGDTMHFQIDCSQSDLSGGIAGQEEEEDDMPSPKDWTPEDWEAFNKNVTVASVGALIGSGANRRSVATAIAATEATAKTILEQVRKILAQQPPG